MSVYEEFTCGNTIVSVVLLSRCDREFLRAKARALAEKLAEDPETLVDPERRRRLAALLAEWTQQARMGRGNG